MNQKMNELPSHIQDRLRRLSQETIDFVASDNDDLVINRVVYILEFFHMARQQDNQRFFLLHMLLAFACGLLAAKVFL